MYMFHAMFIDFALLLISWPRMSPSPAVGFHCGNYVILALTWIFLHILHVNYVFVASNDQLFL